MLKHGILNIDFYHLTLIFIFYSFLGWLMETAIVSARGKSFVNRGFMNGPFCPIYGTGASLFYLFLTPMGNNYPLIFICGMALATAVEYLTSVLLEAVFNAKWWDYSRRRFNIKGRISLFVSFYWGFLSIVIIRFIQPAVLSLINKIPQKTGEIFIFFIIAYILADFAVTTANIIKFNSKIRTLAEAREILKEKFESTNLYVNISDIKIKYSFPDNKKLIERLRKGADEKALEAKDMLFNKSKISEAIDKLESDFNEAMAKHKKEFDSLNPVIKRLIRAFPNLKTRYTKDELIKEIRSHINASRKKKDN